MLGFVYGLTNANAWLARGDTVIGPGQALEGGDVFDSLGVGWGDGFNACYRSQLGWLPPSFVQPVTTNGRYRLYDLDTPGLTNGSAYALRVDRGAQFASSQRCYWVEFRPSLTNNPSTRNGPVLYWGPDGSPGSSGTVLLLDTTPIYFGANLTDVFCEGALQPWHTFSDSFAGVHITPLGRNGTVPESTDVWVNLGCFTNNHPPVVSLTASATNLGVGEAVYLLAEAADPDRDELAYAWDFGDGRVAGNAAAFTQSWVAAGDYVVRCAVSDMKGGTASAAVLVHVGNPGTFTISGHITANGQPLEGVRVATSLTNCAWTGSDGAFTLAGVANGNYVLLPEKAWCQFTPTCLNVAVSNLNVLGTDFTAATNAAPNKAPLVTWSAPVDGGTCLAGTDLDLGVQVYDDRLFGESALVNFYEGTNLLSSAGWNGTCDVTWSNVPPGRHVLRAVATDSLGLPANSPDLTINAVTGPPANDAFAQRIPLSGAEVSVVGATVGATLEPGEPIMPRYIPGLWGSVWYAWTAPSNGVFAVSVDQIPIQFVVVYSGSSLSNLSALVWGMSGAPAILTATQGVVYPVLVDRFVYPNSFTLKIRPAQPPVNDNFANRIPIIGCPAQVTGCNVDATMEADEPSCHGYDFGGASIWWSWTAPSNGTYTVTAAMASSARPMVAVYTGTNLPSLQPVAGGGFGQQSFKGLAGTTYHIAADSEAAGGPGRGDITLSIWPALPPPNDDFANRTVLHGSVLELYGSNAGATREPGEPSHYQPASSSVWWSWTAPFTAQFVLDIDSGGPCYMVENGLVPALEPQVAVYTGSALTNLALVAHQLFSGLSFSAVAGTTYQLVVDGVAGFAGPFRLRLYPETPYFESLSLVPSAGLLLALAAEPARFHVIEASADLKTWLPLSTNVTYGGSILFTDPTAPSAAHRFYRSRSL